MNSDINKKTPAFMYAKEFKLTKVLGNLQAYKLAAGDVGQAEIDEAAQRHGNNLGAVYGSLITKATLNESNKRKLGDRVGTSGKRQKRRRKRRPKADINVEYVKPEISKKSVDQLQTTPELSEPLPLPECLLKEQERSESSCDGDSSSDDDKEAVDFFGLSGSTPDKETQPDCLSQNHQNRELPSRVTSHKLPDQQSQPIECQNDNELCTYRCWKCKRRGHLAEHCTLIHTMAPYSQEVPASSQASTDKDLQDLYMRCRRLKKSKNSTCNECGNSSNLAYCFECGLNLCDGRGHLIDHLLNFPTHTKIYSHKLQRLLKCSNSSCNIVNVTKLLTCSQCLSKTFDRHYSLVNATWSDRGLRAITNAISCEEHFQWHRMNCYNSFEEPLFSQEKMEQLKREHNGMLSEFFF